MAVLIVSDSCTLNEDISGQYLVDSLQQAGPNLADRQLITDNIYKIRAVISSWFADPEFHAVIITDGTGFCNRDSMPEAVSVLFDKQVDCFDKMFRLILKDDIGISTIQSWTVAIMGNNTVIICLSSYSGTYRTGRTQILSKSSWTVVLVRFILCRI